MKPAPGEEQAPALGREPSARAKAEREASERGQLDIYRRILADIFPGRPVKGILAYIDQDRWETVS